MENIEVLDIDEYFLVSSENFLVSNENQGL